jgi:hypothetical protein
MAGDEGRVAVADVKVNIVETEPLQLMVDRAGDDVARRQLRATVEIRHEAVAGTRQLQLPALPSHRLRDQEVLDLRIVQAGRVELVEFHVRHPASGPPRHGDAVARACRADWWNKARPGSLPPVARIVARLVYVSTAPLARSTAYTPQTRRVSSFFYAVAPVIRSIATLLEPG